MFADNKKVLSKLLMLLLISEVFSINVAFGDEPENDTSYASDAQDFTINISASSGSWFGLGGYTISDPSILGNLNSQDSDHIFVRGGDNALWEKTNGNWILRGGDIASNPVPAYDYSGRRHVFVRGNDGRVWDNVDGEWKYLGGSVRSDISVVRDPVDPVNVFNLFVCGSDNSLWMRTVNVNDMSGSWQNLGGIIISNPIAMVDSNKKKTINILVRGSDNRLWLRSLSRSDGSGFWKSLGGVIASNPCVYQESDWSTASGGSEPSGFRMLFITAQGSDNSLWLRILDTRDMSGYWQSLGGLITSNPDAGRTQSAKHIVNTYNQYGVLIGTRTTTTETMSLMVRGIDNHLWRKDISTTRIYDSATGQKSWAIDINSAWRGLGGVITSSPKVAKSGYVSPFRAVVKGGDGSVWMYK